VAQGRDRCRRREHQERPGGARDGIVPACEGERVQPVAEDESRPVEEDDGAVREVGVGAGATAFRGQPPVQVACPQGCVHRRRDGLAVGQVVRVPALPARAVPGGQRHGVVEEEQRRPPARPGQPHPPSAENGAAGDPQVAAVVSDETARVVDEAAAVAGEAAPLRHGVQRAERVDAVR
jgi:hypothetical protein